MEHNAQQAQKDKIMEHNVQPSKASTSRRSFLRRGLAVGGAGAIGAGLFSAGSLYTNFAHAQAAASPAVTKGDVAILRFLAAIEILETDLWQQYNELGGIQDSEVPGGSGSTAYTAALQVLDGDMSQYIHDNTEDEISHFTFLNAYLVSKGADPVNLERFRTLPMLKGQFPAIPRHDADLHPKDHLQAIANTAGFHFGFIEQGGTSLYPSLAQGVTHPEVLRILLSIGPTETAHFQTWHDKAGNAPALTDPTNGLVFPDLNASPFGGEDFQTNLIMPEPTVFLSRKFPPVSIIRPTEPGGSGGAVATVKAWTADGLFIGQSQDFLAFLRKLAEQADETRRG